MKKVFLYARKGNKRNRKLAIPIEKQLEEMRNFCKDRWYEIVEEFYENPNNTKDQLNEEHKRLIDAIKNRNIENKGDKIDSVIVYSALRLCRDTAEAYEIQLLIENEIVIFESVSEYTWEGLSWKRILLNLLITAIYENLEKIEKQKRVR